ncbi:hypothetical protein [Myroides indicus]|uniref:Parallel beta helix pectate lyase-like protein n=1 Tax=Myroides indicus TaxID=1323422 RepID=A0A4R7ETJ7_9FLAO|nr:hypothetical protein [Myroides indicus]TDS57195.1 hypothetical protein C8P70_1167 [Myroides indicus]
MKTLKHVCFTLVIICLSISCRKDIDFEPMSDSLTFSKDTVYLDTVFTNIKSAVYTLKAYNNSTKNIYIPKVGLANGEQSYYKLMIDGISGKTFENIEVLAKDSIYIFIETSIDFDKTRDKSYLYTDQIQFLGGAKPQNIELVSLVRDAYFLYPKKDLNGITEQIDVSKNKKENGFWLTENHPTAGNTLHLTNKKPYVIYGFAAIPEGKKLIIDQGAELFFYNNSGLIAKKNSSIEANGTIEEPIVFTGNRLEYSYRYLPGQWRGIWLQETSKSSLNNLIVTNTDIGLIAENTLDLNLYNVQIYNSVQYGLLAINAQINGKNLITANAGISTMALQEGGNYSFIHSSLVNYWNAPDQTSLLIENKAETSLGSYTFENCLIYSSASTSFNIHSDEANIQKFKFKNNLFKDLSNRTMSYTFPYNYNDSTYYADNFILTNQNSGKVVFADINRNKYQPTDQSSSILGKAGIKTAQKVPNDLSGKLRSSEPDFGAYQHINTMQE